MKPRFYKAYALLAVAAFFIAAARPALAQVSSSSGSVSTGWSGTLLNQDYLDWIYSVIAPGLVSSNPTAMASAQTYSEWVTAGGLTVQFNGGISAILFKDGVPNILRYAMNLGVDRSAPLLPQPIIVASDDGPVVTLTYRRRKGLDDVEMTPQYSHDLIHWQDVPADNIVRLPDDDDYTERYIAGMPLSPGQAAYLRIQARPKNGPVTQWPASAGGNGHYYQVISAPSGTDWNSAQAYAVAHGGYLATLTSAAENAFVFSLVDFHQYWTSPGFNSTGPFIGGYSTEVTHTFSAPTITWHWTNNEGVFAYANWSNTNLSLHTNAGFVSFSAPTNSRQPTWSNGSSSAVAFVVEFNNAPANP